MGSQTDMMTDRPESPEERRQRRRARRWKRRARMAGPFLGLPLLLGTLALSVDFIEYDPAPPKDRLSDRPMPSKVLDKERQRAVVVDTPISTASVVDLAPEVPEADLSATGLDLSIDGSAPVPPAKRTHTPPKPPGALRGR